MKGIIFTISTYDVLDTRQPARVPFGLSEFYQDGMHSSGLFLTNLLFEFAILLKKRKASACRVAKNPQQAGKIRYDVSFPERSFCFVTSFFFCSF